MIDRLYYRVQDVVRLWKNAKFRWKLLTYRDKYKDVKEQGEKGNTNEQAPSSSTEPMMS